MAFHGLPSQVLSLLLLLRSPTATWLELAARMPQRTWEELRRRHGSHHAVMQPARMPRRHPLLQRPTVAPVPKARKAASSAAASSAAASSAAASSAAASSAAASTPAALPASTNEGAVGSAPLGSVQLPRPAADADSSGRSPQAPPPEDAPEDTPETPEDAVEDTSGAPWFTVGVQTLSFPVTAWVDDRRSRCFPTWSRRESRRFSWRIEGGTFRRQPEPLPPPQQPPEPPSPPSAPQQQQFAPQPPPPQQQQQPPLDPFGPSGPLHRYRGGARMAPPAAPAPPAARAPPGNLAFSRFMAAELEAPVGEPSTKAAGSPCATSPRFGPVGTAALWTAAREDADAALTADASLAANGRADGYDADGAGAMAAGMGWPGDAQDDALSVAHPAGAESALSRSLALAPTPTAALHVLPPWLRGRGVFGWSPARS